jgi:hypothetical protein
LDGEGSSPLFLLVALEVAAGDISCCCGLSTTPCRSMSSLDPFFGTSSGGFPSDCTELSAARKCNGAPKAAL